MADYEVLAPGGHENLINNVTERLDEKAYIDGYYAQLTAGAADSLTGRGDGVSASYLYRTTGGDADVADGTATVKSIHGRTVRWNQLVSGMTAMTDQDGITTSYDETTHKFSITNVSRTTNFVNGSARNVVVPAERTVAGHKYVIYGNLPVGVKLSVAYSTNVSGIFTLTEANELRLRVTNDYDFVTAHPVGNVTSFYLNVTDLTAMFGAGNEPSTVAEFEALYPLPYYPYDAGSLLSVQMQGIETVGFNQWDEQYMTSGYFRDTDGAWVAASVLASKNPIPVFPSTTYYLKSGSDVATYVTFWENPHPAGANAGEAPIDGMRPNKTNSTFTTPANCRYIHFNCGSAYGTTYNHDICINLSWSGYRNGEYEPYWQSERTIPAATYFPNGMRSAGTVYDELTSTEAITRVGVVDLGTLDWATLSSPSTHVFRTSYADFPGLPADHGHSVLANAIMAQYTQKSYDAISASDDKCFAMSGPQTNRLIIVDNSYSDAATFKAAMSGVMLHYALVTSTTTPIDPPLNMTYRVSDFGTERIMVPANEQSAAPTQQVVYGLNVVDTVRRLPTEYISHDSFTQFRIALGAKLGVFIIETWDETDGRYEYTINDA